MIYDAKQKRTIPGRSIPSTKVLITWGHLIDVLKAQGEVFPSEEVTHLEYGEHGLYVVVQRLTQTVVSDFLRASLK